MTSDRKKVTIRDIQAKKERGEPITMITAYDYPTALMVDRAGLDMLLVGDSLSMVVLGHETTLPATMDMMIHHAQAVRRGAKYALLIGEREMASGRVTVKRLSDGLQHEVEAGDWASIRQEVRDGRA